MSRCAERVRLLERRIEQLSPAASVARWQVRVARANVALSGWRLHGLDSFAHSREERADALRYAFERSYQGWQWRVERAIAALDVEDPTRPLARGYAIVTKNGVAVRDAAQLVRGDEVDARLGRGTFAARVESVCAE
jgi:exonuclease VII large subunit